MAVPKQHRSKSRQGQRRMHVYTKRAALVSCTKCKAPVLPHIVCANCGTYRGKVAIDVLSGLANKERKQKAKELAQQEQAQEPQLP
jgi:large subunit ribosomal protein L32